jgi:choline-sulfatase
MQMPSNVLLIISDEHQHDRMGCAGKPVITPNLDKLAAGGTRFVNAYTPSPICVPARASIATGQYVHATGCWDNAIAYDGKPQGWASDLSACGVTVESIGKLHYRSATAPVGFRRQHIPLHIDGGIGQVWGSVRNPLPETFGPSPIFKQLGAGLSESNRYDMKVADLAVDWIGENGRVETPWVLCVGFVAPHFPLVVPESYLSLYPSSDIQMPSLTLASGYVRHPWVERQARFVDNDLALGTDERRRLAIACYLGLVTFMDEQVGKVLGALEAHGLRETTTVIYCSDHGDNLGERGMWNKGLLYRESTGVPLIVSGPDVPAGHVSHTPASLIDLQPTILACAYARSEAGEGPGRSLVELSRQADDDSRMVLSEYHAVGSPSAGYMVADARYKYHHYVGFEPELFDLSADPREAKDLSADRNYSAVRDEFEGRLRAILDPEEVDRQAKADQDGLILSFGGRLRALELGPRAETPIPAT